MWLQDFPSAQILICFSSERHCWWNDKCRAASCFWLETHRHAGGEEKVQQEYTSDSVWGEILISRSCQKWCVGLLKQELKTVSLGSLEDFIPVPGKVGRCPSRRNLGSKSIKEGIKVHVLVELLLVHPCGHICLPQAREGRVHSRILETSTSEHSMILQELFSSQNWTNPHFLQSCCIPHLGLKSEPVVRIRAELWASPGAPTGQMGLIPWLASRIEGWILIPSKPLARVPLLLVRSHSALCSSRAFRRSFHTGFFFSEWN